MKKSILLSIALLSIYSVSAQWSTSGNGTQVYTQDNVGIGLTNPSTLLEINTPTIYDGNFVKMGKMINQKNGSRLFNFGSNNTSGASYSGYTVYGLNGKLRSSLNTDNTVTYLGTNDSNGNEIFKVRGDVNSSYIHLPKRDSRIVIGDFASYLETEGHKLVVKEGSAMIEGNIFTDANVGIGTDLFNDNTGNYRLSVDGRIRATAVRVYTGWADFVFEENYNLPTLNEVEQHINTHGHLKDIPSAAVVEAEGIDVGEINKLLLQKIEELTLYTIEQDKKLNVLFQEINNLKSK